MGYVSEILDWDSGSGFCYLICWARGIRLCGICMFSAAHERGIFMLSAVQEGGIFMLSAVQEGGYLYAFCSAWRVASLCSL